MAAFILLKNMRRAGFPLSSFSSCLGCRRHIAGLIVLSAKIITANSAMCLLLSQIAHVVLVEGAGDEFPVQHAATIRLVLVAVAPRAKLTVLHLARRNRTLP